MITSQALRRLHSGSRKALFNETLLPSEGGKAHAKSFKIWINQLWQLRLDLSLLLSYTKCLIPSDCQLAKPIVVSDQWAIIP
ncbi:hypothetical protein CNBG_10098 [Cryptococcus deuterogattii R265]|uniref:uncharacterized protein n=1 Tax=Cryptococcus deuterogattii (strain R265) TaxID=294750 RepID=UPI0019373089|nr:hypothetical protein CNBG_10098 [Cryptococcus deuterogattii R265]